MPVNETKLAIAQPATGQLRRRSPPPNQPRAAHGAAARRRALLLLRASTSAAPLHVLPARQQVPDPQLRTILRCRAVWTGRHDPFVARAPRTQVRRRHVMMKLAGDVIN
jgi:hypothetical protein